MRPPTLRINFSSLLWTWLPGGLLTLLLIAPVAAGMAGLAWQIGAAGHALGAAGEQAGPAFRLLWSQPGLGTSVALSMGTGVGATFLAFGIVATLFAGWLESPVLRVFRRLLGPVLAVPHAAAAIGLAFLLSPSGLLFRAFSPWATGLDRPPDLLIIQDPAGFSLLLGLAAKEIPFLLLMGLAALPQTRCREHLKLARNLGYGRIKAFACFCLPEFYSHLRLPILAVLAYSASNVDMAAVLGPTLPAPLSVRVLSWMNDPALDLRLTAKAGALLQAGVCLACAGIWLLGERAVAAILRLKAINGARQQKDAPARHLALGLAIGLFLLLSGALISTCLWSVAKSWFFPAALPSAWTLRFWQTALFGNAAPLVTTLFLALLSSGLSVVMLLWMLEGLGRRDMRKARTPREGHMLRAMMFLPLIMPQISLLLGVQIWFLLMQGVGSFWGVLLSHLIYVAPYVYLSLAGPWFQLDARLVRTAQSLGMSDNWSFVKIKLPMLLRPLLTAFAIGFAVSVGQYLPSLVIGAGRWPTITTESVALASGGSRQMAGVYALLQTILPMVVFVLATVVPNILFRNRKGLLTA